MNDHEAERIAAAMNQLRPDWPVKQLRTLLRDPKVAIRPRRDICVALAWVACESGTSNPYRVLEAGPWWRAASVDGQAQRREVLSPHERCGVCAKPEVRCRSERVADDDHRFEPDFKTSASIDLPATINALRAEIVQAKAAKTEPVRAIHEPNPNVEVLRHLATTRAHTADAEESR